MSMIDNKYFNFQDNNLFLQDISITDLANSHNTPLYVYSREKLINNYQKIKLALKKSEIENHKICFALKANNNPEIIKTLQSIGCSIDATSPNEVSFAKSHGFKDNDIIFTGNSLSNKDLESLSNTSILINFDSISSLSRFKASPKMKIGLRLNTNVGLGRTKMISTGGSLSQDLPVKFGIPINQLELALSVIRENNFELTCIHHHVGSDWLGEQVEDYYKAFKNLIMIIKDINKNTEFKISKIDLGGGFGVPHSKDEIDFPMNEFFINIKEILNSNNMNDMQIIVEPGNYLVSDIGVLVAQVNTVETKNGICFVGTDVGLNVFNSPSLYNIYHEIITCRNCISTELYDYTVVGNICETGDILGVNIKLSRVVEGDYIAILNAGAYGAVMQSAYNMRCKAKEICL